MNEQIPTAPATAPLEEQLLARHQYDPELEAAARTFLVNAFTSPVLLPGMDSGATLIGAAMCIVCGVNWYQPNAK